MVSFSFDIVWYLRTFLILDLIYILGTVGWMFHILFGHFIIFLGANGFQQFFVHTGIPVEIIKNENNQEYRFIGKQPGIPVYQGDIYLPFLTILAV